MPRVFESCFLKTKKGETVKLGSINRPLCGSKSNVFLACFSVVLLVGGNDSGICFGFFFCLHLATTTQIKDTKTKDQHNKGNETAWTKQLVNYQSHRPTTRHQKKVFNNDRKPVRMKKSGTTHRTVANRLNNEAKKITDRPG